MIGLILVVESGGVSSGGKYILSAIAACRYYSSQELKARIKEAVDGLLSTQDENGYIGTYTDSKKYGPDT